MSAPQVSGHDLTALDASLLRYLARAPHSTDTAASYDKAWTRWVDYCDSVAADPLDANVQLILDFVKAAEDGTLRRPMNGGRVLHGMWAPPMVEVALSAIQERYERTGRIAPCSRYAPTYARVRRAMKGYANTYAACGGTRRSAPPLDSSVLPSIEELLADETAWDLAQRTAILVGLRLGRCPEGLVAAGRDDLTVVDPTTSLLATPAGARLLRCDHAGPLGRVSCARCALHDCAESDHPGDRLIAWNNAADPTPDAINLANALKLRASHWPAAQVIPEPHGSHLTLHGPEAVRVATELALLVASHRAGLARLRSLAVLQITARTGRSTRSFASAARRDDLITGAHQITLLLDRSSPRSQTIVLAAVGDDPDGPTGLEAFWLWVSLMEAADAAPDDPIFCAIHSRGRGLDTAAWLRPETVSSMHQRGGGALPGLAGISSRSPRTAFAANLAADGARLMDITLALGLAKPETVKLFYPQAAGERSRVVLSTLLDLLHRAK